MMSWCKKAGAFCSNKSNGPHFPRPPPPQVYGSSVDPAPPPIAVEDLPPPLETH